MQDSFDAYRYIEHLRGRWRFIAAVSGVAVGIAFIASLLLPKQYTATVSILIEPPGGNDPRAATAVSPVYLESLKGYEQLASSDSVFAQGLDRFQIRRDDTAPVETLKRRILKVTKLRDTKILQISATLRDPKQALDFARYIAEQSVSLNRSAANDADKHMIESAEKQVEAADTTLTKARLELDRYTSAEPTESLQEEIYSSGPLRASLEQQLLDAKANEEQYAARERALAEGVPNASSERAGTERELVAARARVAALQKNLNDFSAQVDRKSATLAHRSTRARDLETALRAAQSSYTTALDRLQEIRLSAGIHEESLQIIDPGVVPQRPSFPNVALNIAAALLAAVTVSVSYLSLLFGYNTKKAQSLRASYRSVAHADD